MNDASPALPGLKRGGLRILWLSWKDRGHPQWGGAEVLTHELRKRFCGEGHLVTHLTSGYLGAAKREVSGGLETIRAGKNRYLHPLKAIAHYNMRLRNKFDIVIEEVNATPYFSVLTERAAKRFLFYHHLEREVWLHEAPRPLNLIGYHLIEPLATRILGRSGVPLITVSESTRHEMKKYGFKSDQSHVISEGIELKPLADLGSAHKFDHPTILSLGGIRAMKRTLDQVKAFELAKDLIPDLQFKLVGDANGAYGRKVLGYIARSRYAADIDYLGKIDHRDKPRIMRSCHLIAVTSIKEGWGLIVTEAASQGTPAVVYDVPGLRDSVRHNQTGVVTNENPGAMASAITELLHDKLRYQNLRQGAWEWSKQITFDQSYKDLKRALGIA